MADRNRIDPETGRLAALEVARQATGPDDARRLLAMLGLDGVAMRKAHRKGRETAAAPPRKPATPPASTTRKPPARHGLAWRDKGLCVDDDTELWTALKGTKDAADAIEACRACPVRQQCGEWACDNGNVEGIWAGYHLGNAADLRRFKSRYERSKPALRAVSG